MCDSAAVQRERTREFICSCLIIEKKKEEGSVNELFIWNENIQFTYPLDVSKSAHDNVNTTKPNCSVL